MQKLLKDLKSLPWQAWLATSDVWVTRFVIATILLVIGTMAQAPSADTDLQAGLSVQSQQEYWRAEALFQQAALFAPHDFTPLLDLARLHRLERRYDLAQSEAEMARDLDQQNADIWLTLGDLAQDQRQTGDAEHAWLQAIHLQPLAAQMQARERLGLLYEQQRRFQQAEAQFSALPESDTLARYHLGALLFERGDRAGARQSFQAVLDTTTDADLSSAASDFLQTLKQWDGSAASERSLGFTYNAYGLPWLAEAPLQQAIALAPSNPDAHAYLGWSYLRLGLSDQAQAEERLAVQLEPGNNFANFVLCVLDLDGSRYDSAINDIETALIGDPKNPVLWATRGQIAEAQGDFPTAENALQHAAANARSDPQFALLLASFYADHRFGLGNGAALQAAQTAVGLAPNNGQAYDVLGRIQQAMNDLTGALTSFDQAVTLDPTSASAHTDLANIQITLGYLRSAELNLRKAIVLDYNGPIARQASQLLQNLPPIVL